MIYLLIGCFLYAIFNLLIQYKLGDLNGLAKAALIGVANVGLAWVLFVSTQSTARLGDAHMWKWALITGAVCCLANIFYFQSYSYGVTAVTGTTMFVTVPIFAALIIFIIKQEQPTGWDIMAFAFAAAAVTCRAIAMSKGGAA